ncbi:MAG TPA: ATP-binding protein [Candidatus Methylomirabilis sp.]|nr:ATP-binding protein [Candidatus Methylomirabilis sp.]
MLSAVRHSIRSLRLRTKFILAVNGLIVVLVTAATLLVEMRQRQTIIREVEKRAVTLAQSLAAATTNDLMTYNFVGLEQKLAEVARQEDVLYAIALDREGLVASHTLLKELEGTRPKDDVNLRALTAEETVVQRVHHAEEGDAYDIAVPILIGSSEDRWGTIRVGVSLRAMQKELAQTALQIFGVGIVAMLFGSIGSILVARRFTTPLQRLLQGVGAISRGDFSQTIEVHGEDEIGQLGTAFNEMTRQLARIRDLEDQLRRSDRLAALGTMAAGIAHDIRNPLTSISIFTQLMSQNFQDPEVRTKFDRVVPRELERVQRVLEDMLELARPASLNREPADINEVLLQVMELFERQLSEQGIVATTNLTFPLPKTMADRKKLHRCFANVIHNGIQAMPKGGRLTISSGLFVAPRSSLARPEAPQQEARETLRVLVTDTGVGIPSELLPHIFDPFFTTKEKGTGLGMAIAHRIIEDHLGAIEVSSRVGGGSTFRLTLPVQAAGAEVPAAPPSEAAVTPPLERLPTSSPSSSAPAPAA